ncbi:MAG: hypothetical protein M1419_08000 [Bacteroidetes bacterium]|nr:hypothetical protein [Bacteroidota bacterium]
MIISRVTDVIEAGTTNSIRIPIENIPQYIYFIQMHGTQTVKVFVKAE